MTNINIKGIDFAALSDAQKAQIATILGVDIAAIEVKESKKKEVNNLQMVDAFTAIDAYSGEQFDISLLTEEELIESKRTGLSPESLRKMNEGLKIKEMMKGKISTPRGPRNAVSAAQQIIAVVEANVDKITTKVMNVLTSKEESKKLFKLAYPLFLLIPENATEAEKKEMRKVNGSNRFAKREWNILGATYFMTNDLYARNIQAIEKYFTGLPEINAEASIEEIEQPVKKSKKKNAKKNDEAQK